MIKESEFKHAIELLDEANNLADKWRDLYGSRIFASLAYCYANLGNKTQARHFISMHDEQYADFGIIDDFELSYLN